MRSRGPGIVDTRRPSCARYLGSFGERLDLSTFYEAIKAIVDRPGRPTMAPKVLLALWLLATAEGIGSARRLARSCDEHDAYRWVRDHVPINYYMLSDFRVALHDSFDDPLTQIIGSLMAAGAVSLKRVAHKTGCRCKRAPGRHPFVAWQGGIGGVPGEGAGTGRVADARASAS